jgi:uncharacterized protein YydD (DUF2326 family)
MIHSVSANMPNFKTVNFRPGFNVVLAARTKEATKLDSRNGLGKSTLLEIIHFCLGANKGETLGKSALNDWVFTLEIDLGGKRYIVSRNTTSANKIIIEGDCSSWPLKPECDKKTGQQIISRKDWTKVLGVLLFGLHVSYPDFDYAPTFRSLFSYFARRNSTQGGFLNPFQQYKAQKEWDKQVNNAFLLELGWQYAAKGQALKDSLDIIKQINAEAKAGVLTGMLGSTGEIEAQKIRLESEIAQEEERLKEFKVHAQYREIENEANELTSQIHELSNLNIGDRQVLKNYEQSLDEEDDADPGTITKMFTEVGVVFPDSVSRRLNDVLSFHKQIVTNRRDFLRSEMERIEVKILKREEQILQASNLRSTKLLVLQKHGALEEYTELQKQHQEKVARLNDLSFRLENLKKFEQGKTAIKIDQALLKQQANTDLSERKAQKERAVLLFNSNSKALYQAPGNLSLEFDEKGFKFKVEIERSGSHGIGNMKIFCYDLMLAQIWSAIRPGEMLLIHDSIIFADVDERQKALALELAASESEQKGFQYICTLNSDSLPVKDFGKDFNLHKYVALTLTDASEDGGLLGIRF